jgi:hypothetical protein
MKTKKLKVFFPDDPVQYSTLAIQNFEYTDPIQQISRQFIKAEAALQRDLLVYQGIPLSTSLLTEILPKRASQAWTRRYSELSMLAIPDNALSLLDTFAKDKQETLLRELVLTHDQLTGLILKAGQHGYTYSQYRVEANFPSAAISSAPKQIKIIKMLDKGKQWHCFVIHYISPSARESYRGTMEPSLYYISSAWQLTRISVINDLRAFDYDLSELIAITLDLGKVGT